MLSYARFYLQINELPLSDRPDDTVIEDDATLDRWWEGFIREMHRKASKRTKADSQDALAVIPVFEA